MKYYFDTNSLRKHSKHLNKLSSYIYTSSLAIFELISGISESDYYIRKETIKNIFSSGIFIDWDTYKKKFFKAFKVDFIDSERVIIEKMAELIVKSTEFSELISFKIYDLNHDYYTLESFKELDKEISEIGTQMSNHAIKLWKKEYENQHRKNINKDLFDKKGIFSFVRTLVKVHLSELVEEITGTVRPNEEYFAALELYDKSLDLYLYCSQFQLSLAQLKGMQFAKNDCIDILHLVFMTESDIMVSDDKIFEKLGKYYYGLKSMSLNDFLNIKEFKS